jgi:hypothetical protein
VGKGDIDFNTAQAIVKAAYPDYRPEKNGQLIEGVYLVWCKKPKPVGVKSLDSQMAVQYFADLGIDLADHLDDSENDYTTRSFGVDKHSGAIILDHGCGWWSKDRKEVAALTQSDIELIEKGVIATGLCRRDELGRVVTNSGDCYLTLVDGNSVWISLKPADDYPGDGSDYFDDSSKYALRPRVTAGAYLVGDGEGGYVEHFWTVWAASGEAWKRRHNPKNNPLDRNLPSDDQLPGWAFCVVGNVIDEHLFGRDKHIVHGTKHFRPGAKLYILDGFWGMGGENLIVMGKPRNRKALIKIVFKRSLIENFRVKQVYDKRIIRELYLPFGEADLQTSTLKAELEGLVEYWNAAVAAKDGNLEERADVTQIAAINTSDKAE